MPGQRSAKGFQDGEHDASVAEVDGNARHEVEDPVGLGVALCIEAIQVEDAQERPAGEVRFGQEALLTFAGVFVEDVEAEVGLVDLERADGIDVFHHQVPGGDIRSLRRTFEHFDKQYVERGVWFGIFGVDG